MPHILLIVIITVAAVGLFALGLSLTLIFKGHNIDSEIATNKNMQRLGVRCAAHPGGVDKPSGKDCSIGPECPEEGCVGCRE